MSRSFARSPLVLALLALALFAAAVSQRDRWTFGLWSPPLDEQAVMPAALELADLPVAVDPMVLFVKRSAYPQGNRPGTYKALLDFYGLRDKHIVAAIRRKLGVSTAEAERRLQEQPLPPDDKPIEIPLD